MSLFDQLKTFMDHHAKLVYTMLTSWIVSGHSLMTDSNYMEIILKIDWSSYKDLVAVVQGSVLTLSVIITTGIALYKFLFPNKA